MSTRKLLVGGLAVLLCIGLALSIVVITWAAPGGGGTQADPFVIDSLPFSESVDTSMATVGVDDPVAYCTGLERTATRWYAFTPAADMQVKAAVSFINYNYRSLTVFMVDANGALTNFACGYDSGELNLTLAAGQKYYFMLSGYASNPDPYGPPTPFGQYMSFSLIELIPPANDNFANAQVISGPPFSVSPELSLATMEPSEPFPSACWGLNGGTAWYAYTPATNAALTVFPNGPVVVYTGAELTSLREVGCGYNYGYRFTFLPQAGTTYYFQTWRNWDGTTGFTLDLTLPPYVSGGYYPSDPSIYDAVSFVSYLLDPGNIGIQSVHWDFGDGTTSDDWNPSHSYAADGDYAASVTATTTDGRSASGSVAVQVRTHDVAIKGFQTPQHITAGQKHSFVVDIGNTHYLESVKVELFKNTTSGLTLFAALVQDVPVGKPTSFKFDYTFTQNDEAVGVDTYQAVATLIGSRDAAPANNVLTIGPNEKLKALNEWTFYSGKWGIVDGGLTTTADWSENWVWAGKPPLTIQGDLTASFNLKLTNPYIFMPGRNGGVMFFASVPTMRSDPQMNGYSIMWVDGYAGELWLTRWDQGQPVPLAVSSVMDKPDPPLQWQVKVEGEWIRFYGDGVLRFEVQDNTYRSGYLGFFDYPNLTKFELSNVQVGRIFRSLMKE